MTGAPFRVGLTRDFLNASGEIGWGDIGLALLDEAPGVEWDFLGADVADLRVEDVGGWDALLVLAPTVRAAALQGVERLRVVARFGVGYDNVDVEACAERGVLVTITPDGVRRPVAVAGLTLVLATAHRLVAKDRLIRDGRWAEKLDHMGMGLTGRTLGSVGFGNIAWELFALAAPLGMRHVAADPNVDAAEARELGVDLLSLEDLLSVADVVVVNAALSAGTHHLLDGPKLALMKPSAYLVNVARGPIVDQAALTEALRQGRIAGAGLDVFEQEPIDPSDPLLMLDNVILAPHAIAWTDELALGNGTSACRAILAVAEGRVPDHVVNPAALQHPRWQGAAVRPAPPRVLPRPGRPVA